MDTEKIGVMKLGGNVQGRDDDCERARCECLVGAAVCEERGTSEGA
jgi:hypothetical protein